MKSVPVRSKTGGHPADRILEIVNKLQEDARARDHEATVRLKTLEDVRTEFQTKLNEAQTSITQLQEQARVAALRWQEERGRFEAQIAGLNTQLKSQGNNQPAQPARGPSKEATAVVEQEVSRVQRGMDEIDAKLADPAIDMAAEMRLKRERVELENYPCPPAPF